MFQSISSLCFLASLGGVALGQAPIPNITIAALPTFSTCQQAFFSWSGGKTPYRVYIYPEGFTNQSDWVVELPLTTRAQAIWNVNLAAGSGIVVNVWDGINDAYSPPSTIQDSGDSSCININGTFQSQASSIPSMALSSRLRPSVISTPSTRPSPTTPPPQSSLPASSSSEAPPATITLIQPNGTSAIMFIDLRWSLVLLCVSIGFFTWI